MYTQFDPLAIPPPQLHRLLQCAIAPRPIALASTVDAEGVPNLSPFSFFNIFGVNPTTIIFSPARRGRDNTTKDTFHNVKAVPEVVINMVNRRIVEQVNLASVEFEPGVNEFMKAGFTPLPSTLIRPFRVAESPVQIECRVREVVETSDTGGAANLVICEALLVHVGNDYLDEDGRIDPLKLDLVGRMGDDLYVHAAGDALFRVQKPVAKTAVGFESLPEAVLNSRILTGNDLAKLAMGEEAPTPEEIEEACRSGIARVVINDPGSLEQRTRALHELIKFELDHDNLKQARALAWRKLS